MTPTSNSVPAMSGPLRRPRQTPCPLRSSSTILQQLMKNLFAHLRGVEPKSLWILARPHLPFLRPLPLLLPLPFRSRLRLRSRRSSRRSSLRGLSRFSLWRYPWPGGITKLPPRESLNVVVTGRTLRPPASRGLGSRCLSFPRAERSRSSVLCRAGDSAAAAGRSGRGGGAEL